MKNKGQLKKGEFKPWIKVCMFVSLGLLLFAGILYGVHYISLDREFHHNEEFFGKDTYEELFSLDVDYGEIKPVLNLAEEAFSFVGTEEEAQQRFGLLSRYSGSSEENLQRSHQLDCLNAHLDGNKGYIWVAYVQECRDSKGQLVSSSGTEDQRILSRWTVEKQNDNWIVTEIKEAP